MRILWSSNAPWAKTGYGNQTDLFIWRLKELGHEITVQAFYGLHGAPQVANGVTFLPGSKDLYGNDVLSHDFKYWKSDILITLIDAWVLSNEMTRETVWCPWFPVDHDPVPPAVVAALRTAFYPIAYSRWGQERLEAVGIPADYIPHGVDTKALFPMAKAGARKAMGVPDDVFLVGMVAANTGTPSRKAFDQNIRGFAEFVRRRPDANALFYLHTDFYGGNHGEDIMAIVDTIGLPRERIAQPPPYPLMRGMLDSDYMRAAYSAMDVLTNATRGEGFGVPILEAQSCGTPVIVTDFSSMPELVFSGWKVPYVDRVWNGHQNSYQVVPSVSGIADAFEMAYDCRNDISVREKARAGALEYDADTVTERYWKPVLEKIEGRIKRQSEVKARRKIMREKARAAGAANV